MQKPCNCQTCPLYAEGIYVPSEINNSDACIIGEQPALEESSRQIPFVGRSGELLDILFHLTGLTRKQFNITNAIKCYTSTVLSKKVKKEVANCCKAFLYIELLKMRPKYVLNLGSYAQESIDERNVTAMRGFVRDGKIEDLTFRQLCTFHPASCFKTPENFDLILADLKRFKSVMDNTFKEDTFTYEVIENITDVKRVLDTLAMNPSVAVDIETDSFELGVQILCVTLAYRDKAYVIPFTEELKPLLTEFLCKPLIKVGQNFAFDLAHFKYNGIDVKGPFFDTMMAHFLLVTYLPHDLNTLATLYTNLPEWESSIRDIIGFGKKALFSKIPKDKLYPYTAQDGIATWSVYSKLRPLIRQHNQIDISKHLMEALETTVNIRLSGVRIDIEKLPQVQKQLDDDIKAAQKEVFRLAKKEFNINSTKQLAQVLFEDLKLRCTKRTKKGALSADKNVLNDLIDVHPVISELLTYRTLSKLRSTFVPDDLVTKLDSDYRLHTTYKPTGTTSLRLSSSGPNLQNIPRKAYIRQLFCVRPGYKWVEVDYEAAELYVAAFLSKETKLLTALQNGLDIHRMVASDIFKILPEQISDEQRVMAKFVVYGILYGRGAQSISTQFKISLNAAERILQAFCSAYVNLIRWVNTVVNHAREHRMLVTPFGFARRWPVYGPFLPDWEREARSLLPQSIIGCKTVQSMNMLHCAFKDLNLDAQIVLNVHDSLCFEVFDEILIPSLQLIKTVMESPILNLGLSIPCEISVGKCWWDDNALMYKDGQLVKVA